MARLKITIEGEMSPEEMKRYIAAAWGNLPRDIAVSEVDLDEPVTQVATPVPTFSAPVTTATAPAPEPEPAPTLAAPVAGQLSEGQVIELASAGKVSAIVQAIRDIGVTDTEAITAEVLRIKGAIPGLAKLSEQQLVDRIPRVLEMMQ